ncbi:MAG: hybrid sensor histidine kinase/response regulator [Hyphomonadaceae bacterium]|nr:hybrid sensor histidine kinase/response regulator [Hyphomonadaceae bacterium]
MAVSDAQSVAGAMERLVGVVQELSQARDRETVIDIVRRAARALTGADGASFVLRDNGRCYYVDEDAISPLWKGQRFPMETCISGWAMLNAQAAVIEDIYADPRIPADAYRPTFVKSLAMVPIRQSAPIGAIGTYWAQRRKPTDGEVKILQALADTTSVALENAQLYEDLQEKIVTLSEREARITEQRDRIDVFARSLAHDLREPVRTISSYSDLLAEQVLTPETHRQYLDFVRQAGARMGMLIDTVQQYALLDGETVSKAPLDLTEAAEAAKANLAALIRERSAAVVCEALPRVVANRAQMIQVFQNLIANAIAHCEGKVVVHISAQRAKEFVAVCVRDNGPGIAAEHQERIFQPFRRLNRANTHAGLGLAICRKVLEIHEGAIACRSALGQGAAFIFTLPAPAEAAIPAPRAEAPRDPNAPATVLIIDDREPDVRLARTFLGEPLGMRCKFLVAHDGQAGLDAIASAAQNGTPVDLIILDINMPVMDGFEMLERMRADAKMRDIAVVMCSGSTQDRDVRRAAELGALGYLSKPPKFDQLRSILEEAQGFHFESDGAMAPVLRRAA